MLIGDGWLTCEHCNKHLTGRQRKYCSESCRVAEYRDSKRPREKRDCELCGDSFAVRYRNQRICDYNSRQASEDCMSLQDDLVEQMEEIQEERENATCEREGCEEPTYRPGRGRPKRYCSPRCRTAFYRAQRKAADV